MSPISQETVLMLGRTEFMVCVGDSPISRAGRRTCSARQILSRAAGLAK